MAGFRPGEPLTDEPFKLHLGPLQVATSIQVGISASWRHLAGPERSVTRLNQFVAETFDRVERWWLSLNDRAGVSIVRSTQQTFGPPPADLPDRQERWDRILAWLPAKSFAESLFWAWLLQPEATRTPLDTAQTVRQVLQRQLQLAEQDITLFGSFDVPSDPAPGPFD